MGNEHDVGCVCALCLKAQGLVGNSMVGPKKRVTLESRLGDLERKMVELQRFVQQFVKYGDSPGY